MSLVDKRGNLFEVRSYSSEEFSCLEEMYDQFAPKAGFQGMPPTDKKVRTRWLQGLAKAGENFMAWQEVKVIGHVVILPDFKLSDAEYLIFVLQTHRGVGIGGELTWAAIERAKALSIKTVWLTVDAYNFRATRLYKKFGFEFRTEYSAASERMMALTL